MFNKLWIRKLSGTQFSPREAEKLLGISFVTKNEPNEIGTTGAYKGKAIPYGSCKIETSPQMKGRDELWIAGMLDKYINQLRAAGVEDVMFTMVVEHDGQCNFELSADFLAKMAKLQIPLGISCYRGD